MNKIWWKKIHNVLGILSALFLLILLITGILLNHPSSLHKGEVETIAADPSNSERLLSSRKEGLFYSLNGGKNWEEVSMLYPPEEVTDIIFSPENPKNIYVLEKWGRILASKDGGRIWETIQLPFDPQSQGIELKKLSVGEKEKLVILTSHGWISSEDNGKNWDESYLNKNKMPLYRLIMTLHNGYFFGPRFLWVYDFAAASLLILIVSGLVLWNIGRKIG